MIRIVSFQMDDIFLSIVAKIAEYAVGPILQHARYLCCFNNYAGNLSIAKEKLELTQDSMKERVREATNRTEKIEATVEKWLKDVENVLGEVQLLEGRIPEVRKSYFKRRCQYFLAKEISKKIKKMTELNRNSKFEPFSRIIELPGMKYYSSKDFVLFKSIESAYNKVLEELKDKSVSMIGLVGIGGSGKTTLAKEVGKKVEELKLFEKVVMVTVSQPPNIRNIQAQIADKLGTPLGEESNEGRAQRLSQRLSEGITLLILDDVWEKLNFESLGIPCNENNKGCGVLLTTRSGEVCTSMQCQSIIELNLLTTEEAWTLFKLHANINDDSPNALQVVARKVVNECKGLPIAIVTVGSTLRGKTLGNWKSALSRLQNSKPLVMTKGLRSPHACLQLSFDNLIDELAKSLFLLFSIFPEDHEIDLEDLFRFGRGLGLIGTFGTLEEARAEVHVAVNILLDSRLLLHAGIEERVKMHDMVRDVALWIASERGQAILASSGMDPRMLAEDESIKDKRAISLWYLENGQLLDDDQFNCPTLEMLLLQSPNVGFKLSNACLEKMKMIKTLAFLLCGFMWNCSWIERIALSLPQSILSLKSLHTLSLRGYQLGDISVLGSLQALEILDLRGSSFQELPNGIVALKKLKLLDLYCCLIEKSNAYEVIRRCLQLEELYLHLLQSEEDLPHDISFPRLQRYVIIQRNNPTLDATLEIDRPSRGLLMENFNASAQNFIWLPIKNLFVRAEYLSLKWLWGGYKNLIPSMDPQGMNQLIFLYLKSCVEIECLFDSTMLQTEAVFSNLSVLSLHDLYSLREVFYDPSSRCSLENLQQLWIRDCEQLYNISFPRNSKLSRLKEISINKCPMLTSLFVPSIANTLVLLESLKIYECNKLNHIIEGNVDYVSDQSHTSLTLPKLRIVEIKDCNKLEYIFPACIAGGLVSLEIVQIIYCQELKYVFGTEKEHHLSLYKHHETNMAINLDILQLHSLPNLVDIWPEYCRPHLPNLKILKCVKCPGLSKFFMQKAVFDSDLQQHTTEMENDVLCLVASLKPKVDLQSTVLRLSDVGVKGLFQFEIGDPGKDKELVSLNLNLSSLTLRHLPELKFIWKGPINFLSLPVLEYINVNRCPKLKIIFSPTIVRSLPVLKYLVIRHCEELEQIFDSGDADELKSLYTCSQQLCFPELKTFQIQNCNKLKCLFYNFMAGHFSSLSYLQIKECFQLEKVFNFEDEADNDNQEGTGKDGEQVLLQNLQHIRLKSLPNFKEIHHRFKLKDHVEQTVEDCPKYAPSLYLHQVLLASSHSLLFTLGFRRCFLTKPRRYDGFVGKLLPYPPSFFTHKYVNVL
ncbi:Disease resistance protein, partial [Mucuna pruriens]